MASTVRVQVNITASLAHAAGNKPYSPSASVSITPSGKYVVESSITVPTSDTTLSKGSIGTVGLTFVQNLDDTNYIQVGDGTNWLIRLLPGEVFLGRWDTGTPHVKAHTSACDIYYFMVEA